MAHIVVPSDGDDVHLGPLGALQAARNKLGRGRVHRREDDSLWMRVELGEVD